VDNAVTSPRWRGDGTANLFESDLRLLLSWPSAEQASCGVSIHLTSEDAMAKKAKKAKTVKKAKKAKAKKKK
jgi:hypothetical protein